MSDDRWQHVAALYQAAQDRTPEERSSFVKRAAAEDSDLRRDVESLLALDDRAVVIDEHIAAAARSLLADNPGMQPGSFIGPYRIDSLLGAGGMGEVYRAHDTKLNREVAIKLLPSAFATDPDRLARFKREAQVLASLNHPNIAAIYGFEDSGEEHALVLEIVEGPTLADRIARGPLPMDEALKIARQIAAALEAAHERGIVHRDLKPANIKVRADDTVKVLDFGLAKALEPTGVMSSSVSMSPTITSPAMTQAGIILGTAAYMSPEQAVGKPVDKRSDLWSFGVVLLEMLTGHQVFEGETVSHVLASVLKDEPAWAMLPTTTPVAIRRLLTRCLQKDPKRRLDSALAVRLEIDDALNPVPASTVTPTAAAAVIRRRGRAVAIIASFATMVFAVGGIVGWTFKPAPPSKITRFSIALPDGQLFTNTGRRILAMSPDGSELAYVGNTRLYLRRLSEGEARPITPENINVTSPAFSPDGQSLVYWASDNTLKKIAATGGAALTLCAADNPYGLSWGPAGIVFGQGPNGILRISPNGGQPEPIASVKATETASSPQVLPDGDTLLFTIANLGAGTDRWDRAQIVAQSLRTGQRSVVLTGGADARYLPTGHLVYALGGVLLAVRFDAKRRTVTAGPVPVVEGVRRSGPGGVGAAHFSVSNDGFLVYVSGPANTSTDILGLALFDRQGTAKPLGIPRGPYEHPRVSPDGQRIVFGSDDGKDAKVYVYELSGSNAMRPLTFGGQNKFPIWSGDGKRVLFQSDRDGSQGIFWQRADGSDAPEQLTTPAADVSHVPESSSPDGQWLLFSEVKGARVRLMLLSLKDHKTTAFDSVEATTFTSAAFSPDGRWVAYSGRGIVGPNSAVFVQPFPPTRARYQLSKDLDGHHAVWTRGGKELAYIWGPGQFVTIDVTTQPTFSFSLPKPMPQPGAQRPPNFPRNYDITPDGQRFIGVVTGSTTQSTANTDEIRVVLNWFDELKARVATN